LIVIVRLMPGCAAEPTPAPHPIADAPEDPATEAFDNAANRPPTVRTIYVMAKLYIEQGRYGEAEAALKKVMLETPKFVPAYADLAELQLRQQRNDDAIATLTAGLKVAPQDPVLLNDLGMCHLRKAEHELALQSFQAASKVRPQEPRYRSNAAVATALQGRYDEALDLYLQVLPPADAHYNLGVICESMQNHDRAAKEFQKAIELGNNRQPAAAAESRALGLLAARAVQQQPPEPNAGTSVGAFGAAAAAAVPTSQPSAPARE
jgi:Flp pilus assembly protein TadD